MVRARGVRVAHGVEDEAREVDVGALQRPPGVEAGEDVPDGVSAEPGPEQLALDAFDAETVGKLLDTLPPKLREIITLRVGAGMSAEETGRALDMTAGAVRVAQHRAMQKLRKIASEDLTLRVAP